MKKVILLSILFIVQLSCGYACDCFWGGNFFKLSQESDVVAKVKVIGYEQLDQDFNEILVCETIHVYKGSKIKDTIRLRGDNGMFCAPYVSYFKIGQQYILQFDNEDNYTPWLSNCGEYYLLINDGKVYSEEGLREDLSQIGIMTLSEFEKKIINNTNKKNVPQLDKHQILKGIVEKNVDDKTYGINDLWISIVVSASIILLILYVIRKRNANNT